MSNNISLSPDDLLGKVNAVYLHGIAMTLSAITYTVLLIVYQNCCRAILKPCHLYSKRKQRTLLAYTTYLMVVSTVALVQTVCTFSAASAFTYNAAMGFRPTFFPLTFALWGADGFMIWRCRVLYSTLPRLKSMIMRCFLGVLSMGILVTGSILPSVGLMIGIEVGIALVSTSIVINAILTTLIVGRILYHQKFMGQHFGDAHKSLYTRVISLCVESCAIILVFEIPFVVTMSSGGAFPFVIVEVDVWADVGHFDTSGKLALMLFNALPHVFAISALLLIYRVAEARDITQSIKTAEIQNFGRFQPVEELQDEVGPSEVQSTQLNYIRRVPEVHCR